MKKYIVVVFLFSLFLLSRINEFSIKNNSVTTYDAFGYYMYLPACLIYNDPYKLDWVKQVDSKYKVIGSDWFYQAKKLDDGNYVLKYFCGVSIMQAPFFLMADSYVLFTKNHPRDGFSYPYQFAVIVSAFFYFGIALLLLYLSLQSLFSSFTAYLTLIAIYLTTNIMQYVSFDTAMSHGYIFFWYTWMLYLCIKWSEKPSFLRSIFIGISIGGATLCRPTDAIIAIIPAMWLIDGKTIFNKENWLKYRVHFFASLVTAFIVFLPQIIYWKLASDRFLIDTGSKWTFLNPWWRVLFGWEKGWFVYTPITIFGVTGLFLMKDKAYKKSVIWFFVINIWIVISWFDWQYGASYSCRALAQSLPILAVPLGHFIEKFSNKKFIIATFIAILSFINLFQIWQYNKTILHFNLMNRTYYSRIFLNPKLSALDISTLYSPIYIDTTNYQSTKLSVKNNFMLSDSAIKITDISKYKYLKIDFVADNRAVFGNSSFSFFTLSESKDTISKVVFPSGNFLTKSDALNYYSFFIKAQKNNSLWGEFRCAGKRHSVWLNSFNIICYN